MAAIDTEQLIREVQKRRAIWDLRYPLYKDRDVKQSCWVEIMKELFENVDDWTQREKEKTLKSLHQRWKSARDQYVRYKTAVKFKKSGSGAIPKRKYVFADCMSFLDPVTDLSDVHESESVENAQTSDNPLTQNDSRDPENDLPNVRNKKKKTQEMTTFEKQLVEMWNSTNSLAFDEDVAFFNSILPAVRRLDFEKKYFFRSQVLQLLVGINQYTCTSLVPCQSTNMGPSTSIGPSTSMGQTTSMGPSTSAGPAMPSTSKVSPVSASSCSTDNYDTEGSFDFDFTTL